MRFKWVSVTDRLPELHPSEDVEDVYISDRLLLYIPGRYEEIVIGEYEKNTGSEGFDVDGCWEKNITHWAPLPHEPNPKCSFCGSSNYYAKGLCVACYHRLQTSGQLEYRRKGKPDEENKQRLIAFWNDFVKDSDLNKLDDRRRRIAYKRFCEGKTLRQISQEELVTYERVRQIVISILKKLNLFQMAQERNVIR